MGCSGLCIPGPGCVTPWSASRGSRAITRMSLPRGPATGGPWQHPRSGVGHVNMQGMCGRYVVAYDPQTLVAGFSLTRVVPFPRRWNVTPQSAVPVVHQTREGERIAELMRWGLVPHWAKEASIGHKLNNARAEGVAEKPSFRQALRRRRCILPASGFYEWQATADGKQPWYITRADGEPLASAAPGPSASARRCARLPWSDAPPARPTAA